ncbi:MAG: hypothetical protein WCV64_11795, partial [Desulfurivibrionaceae bacterium]
FLLLRAQKKKQEKGTPASPGPAGFPCFSPGAAGQMGGEEFPLARSRAPERLPKRGFALFEAKAEFAKPRQHRGAQGLPPSAGQVTRVPFLRRFAAGSFLWASKEMNILISHENPRVTNQQPDGP